MRRRVNGFDFPMTGYQLGAIGTYVVVVTFYQLLMFAATVGKWTYLMMIDACLTVITLVCWFIIEYLDPAHSAATPEYYCQLCGKRIPKLDHHCVWLNTCIGARNVKFFLMLIGTLFVQEGLQLVVLATSSLWSLQRFKTFTYIPFLLLGHAFLCGIMWIGVSLLVGFHVYLQLIVRKTTYDWIISRTKWPEELDEEPETVTEVDPSRAASIDAAKKEAWESYLLMKREERQKPVVDILASVHESQRSNSYQVLNSKNSSHSYHSGHHVGSGYLQGSEMHSLREGNNISGYSAASLSSPRVSKGLENDSIKSPSVVVTSSEYRPSEYDGSPSRRCGREPVVNSEHMVAFRNRNPNDSLVNNNSYKGSSILNNSHIQSSSGKAVEDITLVAGPHISSSPEDPGNHSAYSKELEPPPISIPVDLNAYVPGNAQITGDITGPTISAATMSGFVRNILKSNKIVPEPGGPEVTEMVAEAV